MVHNRRLIVCAFALAVLIGSALGCQPDASVPLASDDGVVAVVAAAPSGGEAVLPVLETYADSVAMRVYEASGGPAAWQSLRYLRFNFAVARGGARQRTIKHFWDRHTGAYRLERRGPANNPYVVLFNVKTRQGRVYWGGDTLDTGSNAEMVADAYRRFINDSYWLVAPFKLFDPGVNRTYVPDSSNALVDVIHLSFGDVGLTPGDQYWLYVDKETGRLVRWTYVLQDDHPDAPPRSFVWEGYEEHVTPAGPLYFATYKRGIAAPFSIHTDAIETPTLVPDDLFISPEPRLNE